MIDCSKTGLDPRAGARRNLLRTIALAALGLAPLTTARAQQAAAPPAADPALVKALAPIADEDTGPKMPLMLNNVPIDQLVQLLSELTGKPVYKNNTISQQITVSSPTPVSKRQALNLISEALRIDNIYIIETDDQIQIVPATMIRTVPVMNIPDDTDMQSLPDSFRMAQKIYHLKFIKPENLKPHLDKLVPDAAMTYDLKTNTLILKDTVAFLKRYDLIINTLDQADKSDYVIETFELAHIDALELAVMLGNVMMNQNTPPDPSGRTSTAAMAQLQAANAARAASSARSRVAPTTIVVGDITFVPDTRMNRLVVSAPERKMEGIRKLILDFDQPESLDMQVRTIEIKRIDPTAVSTLVGQLMRDIGGTSAKDVIRIVPYDDGNAVLVYSSEANFKIVQGLIAQLDVEGSEKRETRTYNLEHLTAMEMAEQLTSLWNDTPGKKSGSSLYSYNYYTSSGTGTSQPSFVPSPRTNTLMVLAKPKDFTFIEEMIKELDLPVKEGVFDPHIYHVRHTDANELVKVLEALFQDKAKKNASSYSYFRQDAAQGSIESLFGEIRFVVDNVTNTIVALTSNPKTYETLDDLVHKLDQEDPQATEVLVYELKHADANEVATHLNNLFSDGTFSQPPVQPAQARTAPTSSSFASTTTSTPALPQATTYFPWQAAQRNKNPLEETRPINTMIGNVRVVPDQRANKIMIAAPPIYFDSLRQMVEDLDLAEPQVHIKTRIIEITRGDEKRVGVRWTPDPSSIDPAELDNAILGLSQIGVLSAFGGGGGSNLVTRARNLNGASQTIVATTKPGNAVLDAGINIALLAQLLIKNSDGRILSEPALTVNNNEPGELFVGSRFPFQVNSQTTDRGSTTFGIEYRDVGIKLLVTPHINQTGQVVLTADIENSAVRDQLINGQVVEDSSRFHTEIAIDSGQTMVIGGILVDQQSKTKRTVPILGRIPIIKHLVSKNDRNQQTRELIVLITPEVISNDAEIGELLKRSVDNMGKEAPEDWREMLDKPPIPGSEGAALPGAPGPNQAASGSDILAEKKARPAAHVDGLSDTFMEAIAPPPVAKSKGGAPAAVPLGVPIQAPAKAPAKAAVAPAKAP